MSSNARVSKANNQIEHSLQIANALWLLVADLEKRHGNNLCMRYAELSIRAMSRAIHPRYKQGYPSMR